MSEHIDYIFAQDEKVRCIVTEINEKTKHIVVGILDDKDKIIAYGTISENQLARKEKERKLSNRAFAVGREIFALVMKDDGKHIELSHRKWQSAEIEAETYEDRRKAEEEASALYKQAVRDAKEKHAEKEKQAEEKREADKKARAEQRAIINQQKAEALRKNAELLKLPIDLYSLDIKSQALITLCASEMFDANGKCPGRFKKSIAVETKTGTVWIHGWTYLGEPVIGRFTPPSEELLKHCSWPHHIPEEERVPSTTETKTALETAREIEATVTGLGLKNPFKVKANGIHPYKSQEAVLRDIAKRIFKKDVMFQDMLLSWYKIHRAATL